MNWYVKVFGYIEWGYLNGGNSKILRIMFKYFVFVKYYIVKGIDCFRI